MACHILRPLARQAEAEMRRASATGMLDNLGGEGKPLPESHGRDSSTGQAAIQRPSRVAKRRPQAARRSLPALTLGAYARVQSNFCTQAPHAGLDAEVRPRSYAPTTNPTNKTISHEACIVSTVRGT